MEIGGELNPYDRVEKQRLKVELEEIKALSEREWLLKQLEWKNHDDFKNHHDSVFCIIPNHQTQHY